MAIISDKLNKILSSVFGKDVRQALHDGLYAINKETESTTARQDYLDRKYDEQIKNMTLQDPSTAEIVDMRVAANGKTFKKAGDRLNYFDEQLDNITVIMPLPSTVEENTSNLQKILNKAKDKNINLTVQFLTGYYELKTCFIYDNTTIKMTSNTVLKNVANKFTNPETATSKNISILFMNAKPYDNEDSNITRYDGRSNITIDGNGATLDTISAFLLCHGQNIIIKNITFKNCDSDHYIQIAACKNVKIQNCKFVGVSKRSSNREYVEFVQIDWMTATGQPYWSENANIFDSTVNDCIEIDGCEFENGIDKYSFMYTCIGSHSSDGANVNKNITVKNCTFNGYSYGALIIDRMSNVFIDNNIFNDSKSTCAINITNSNNVVVSTTNKINGGNRAIYCKDSSNIEIDGVLIEEVIADSDFILIGECTNVELNRVNFINCDTNGCNVLIRNCKDINADSCKDINTDTLQGYFFRVYTKNDGINDRITIRNTITDKKEISLSSANSIICSKEETIWSGTIANGEIPLNVDINKFKNLKIHIFCYGNMIKNLLFDNNIAYIKEFNLRDDSNQSLRINLNEIKLTLDDSKIIINHNNQVDIFGGIVSKVDSNMIIKKITGERVYY